MQYAIVAAWRRTLTLIGLLGALTVLISGCGVTVSIGKAHLSFGNTPKHRSHHARYLAYSLRRGRSGKGRVHRQAIRRQTARSVYAEKLLSVLDSSTPVFDQAASRASSAQGADLADVCNQYGSQINILEAEFEGVPHPYTWYSNAGWLHHTDAGIFHQMLGALQQCETAVSNDDSVAISAVLSDVGSAAGQMHRSDAYAHWLARHG